MLESVMKKWFSPWLYYEPAVKYYNPWFMFRTGSENVSQTRNLDLTRFKGSWHASELSLISVSFPVRAFLFPSHSPSACRPPSNVVSLAQNDGPWLLAQLSAGGMATSAWVCLPLAQQLAGGLDPSEWARRLTIPWLPAPALPPLPSPTCILQRWRLIE